MATADDFLKTKEKRLLEYHAPLKEVRKFLKLSQSDVDGMDERQFDASVASVKDLIKVESIVDTERLNMEHICKYTDMGHFRLVLKLIKEISLEEVSDADLKPFVSNLSVASIKATSTEPRVEHNNFLALMNILIASGKKHLLIVYGFWFYKGAFTTSNLPVYNFLTKHDIPLTTDTDAVFNTQFLWRLACEKSQPSFLKTLIHMGRFDVGHNTLIPDRTSDANRAVIMEIRAENKKK